MQMAPSRLLSPLRDSASPKLGLASLPGLAEGICSKFSPISLSFFPLFSPIFQPEFPGGPGSWAGNPSLKPGLKPPESNRAPPTLANRFFWGFFWVFWFFWGFVFQSREYLRNLLGALQSPGRAQHWSPPRLQRLSLIWKSAHPALPPTRQSERLKCHLTFWRM